MTTKHLLFIDPRVAERNVFEASLPAETVLFVLHSEQSGIEQIASISQGFINLESIQIISHGELGGVQVGADELNATNLDGYRESFQAIGTTLADTGDLILYGCNVGQGSVGIGFVQQLARLTRADIAASDDLTGAMELGGDWDLEVQTGTITSAFAFEKYEAVLVSEGNDSIVGTANADILSGLGGNDTIVGLEGNDLLDGGNGNDKIFGGAGDDTLISGNGTDTLEGGDGNDRLTGTTQPSVAQMLDGGVGNDTILGDYSYSTLIGGAGDDVISAKQAEYVFGGDGSDFVNLTNFNGTKAAWGGEGDDTISVQGYYESQYYLKMHEFEALQLTFARYPVSVPDSFFAAGVVGQILQTDEDSFDKTIINAAQETDANLIITGATIGQNILTGGALGDQLTGGSSHDTLTGSGGNDTLYGGEGLDSAFYSGKFADYVISTIEGGLQIQGGTDGVDSLFGINTLVFTDLIYVAPNPGISYQGTPGNDIQSGGEYFDTLVGNQGNDQLSGLRGNDLLDGGEGDDYLRGGEGDDLIFGGTDNDTLIGDAGFDTLEGANGNDFLLSDSSMSSQAPLLSGGLGNDTLEVRNTSLATVLGGEGNDSLTVASIYSASIYSADCGPGADTLNWAVSSGNNSGGSIDGGEGMDYLSLTSGSTTIQHLPRFRGFETLSYLNQYSVVPLFLPDGFFAPGGSGAVFLSNYQSAAGFVDASDEKDSTLLLQNLSQSAATLVGGALNDTLRSSASGNSFRGSQGNDELFGGLGLDTALFSGTYSDYTITVLGGCLQVSDTVAGRDGVDLLRDINFLTFSDRTVNVPPVAANFVGTEGADSLLGGEGNDTLNGLTEADQMTGQTGDDTYYVENVGDRVVENFNGGSDLILSYINLTLPQNVEKLTLQGASKIGTGNNLNNLLIANSNGSSLFGNPGNDTLIGGKGNDYLNPGTGTDHVFGNPGADTIIGSLAPDHDVYNGGDGIDIVSYNPSLQALKVNLATGEIVGSEIDTHTFISIDGVAGGAGADSLVGNVSPNLLDGGKGVDTMIGGLGNDTYGVDSANDMIVEGSAPADGKDTVLASLAWTLAVNLENLTLTGISPINATGNTVPNALTGNQGANVLNGQGGSDTMAGAAGNDTYHVDNPSDVIIESGVSATELDFVLSSVSRTLETNVENLEMLGSASLTGIGNASANKLVGNRGANLLDGKFGADTLIGGSGSDDYVIDNLGDSVIESGLNPGDIDTTRSSISYKLSVNVERLVLLGNSAIDATGTSLPNMLFGNVAPNRLDGLAGADSLQGGAGADTYIVDDPGDVVYESTSAITEIDTIQSSVSYTLQANVEHLTLTGAKAIDGIGNPLANWIRGTSGANLLDGRGGADTLEGATGADSYYLDNTKDVVIESSTLPGEVDTILSSVHCTLPSNLENLTLLGNLSLNAFGNSLGNSILGNAGNNRLDGKEGADVLQGKEGRDTYVIDNLDDSIIESGSSPTEIDSVESIISWTLGSNLENLTLGGAYSLSGTGNTLSNRLVGNSASNFLNGNAGNDILSGANSPGGGASERDTLTGGAGNDFFVLGNVNSTYYNDGGLGDFALIVDFQPGSDRLLLSGTPGQYRVAGTTVSGGEVGLYLSNGLSSELIAVINSPHESPLTSAAVIGTARFV